MCFHNRAIDQVQTVARFCRQRVENTLPDSSPRPAVEPIVRARVWAVAFGQIAPWDPRPQHVKYCIHDPPVVRARALPTLRHERLESRPFLIAEIESHDPPPPAVNHDAGCFSVNYAGTDPSVRPRGIGGRCGLDTTAAHWLWRLHGCRRSTGVAEALSNYDDIDQALAVYNAARQPLSERIVLHSRKLGTQLGVGIETDDDRELAKILQSPRVFWIGLGYRISWLCDVKVPRHIGT